MSIGIACWAVIDQAGEQEEIDQSHGIGVDPKGRERVDVHAAHLDILNALARERNDGRFTALRHPFGPDGAVVLVFDLQQRGVELRAFSVVHEVKLRVVRMRRQNRIPQGANVLIEVVVADVHPRLRIAGVAEITHSQGGGVGQEKAVMILTHRLQRMMFIALHKARADRGGGTEQIHQQPDPGEKVPDQRQVAFGLKCLGVMGSARQITGGRPKGFRHRKVVVNTGNRLHLSAITHAQPVAIDPFHPANI